MLNPGSQAGPWVQGIIVNGFGQNFPAALPQSRRAKECASWNKGANELRHDFSLP
jgi:hypothetical protein